MSKVAANGISMHVQRLGPDGQARATVVFIHGLLTDSLASYYFTLGPALAREGIDVVMYDLRGHGRTTKPESGYQISDFVDDLVALLDALDIRTPVHLVGNSFGGAIAFAAAAAAPERVASVISIEAQPPVRSWSEHMKRGLDQARDYLPIPEIMDWLTENEGAHTARLARNASRTLAQTTIADDICSSAVLDDALSAVHCRVLGIFGADSDILDQVRELGDAIADWELVVIDDQGHSVLIEQVELTQRLIRDWVTTSVTAS